MRYLCLIYEDEARRREMTKAETDAIMDEYHDFTDAVKGSGHYLAGEPLQPAETATTVRVRGRKRLVSDGPFVESREQRGGYYVIEASHLDDAIDVAARIPGARTGAIEIRPVRPVRRVLTEHEEAR